MNTQTDFKPTDWGIYATCYDTLIHLEPYQQLITQVVNELDVQSSDRILDLGCGTGNLMKEIVNQRPCHTLAGIDFSPNMLNRAEEKCRGQNTSFVQADVNATLPWNSCSFSKIVCVNALYTFTNPAAVLHEAHRVLDTVGEIVLVTPKQGFENGLILKAHAEGEEPDAFWENAHSSPEREEMLIRTAISDEQVVQQMLYIAHHNRLIAKTMTFHFFTPKELESLFLETGFTVIKTTAAYADQGILIHARKEEV